MNSFFIRPLSWFCIFLANCSLFGAGDEAGSEGMQKTGLMNEEEISALENFLKEHIANSEGLSLPELLAIAHSLRSAYKGLTANQIFQAFTCGDLLTVFFLLQNEANINFLFIRESQHDCTPLHMAAMKGHAKIFELLINLYQQGKIPCRYLCAWILSQNAYGNTILHLAIINNHSHIVGLLIDLEIAGRLPEKLLLNLLQIHNAQGNNIFHFAADQNQAVFFQALLIFIRHGKLSPEIVSLLLVLLKKCNAFFCTPLHRATNDTIAFLIAELLLHCSMTSCSSSKFQPHDKEDPDDDSKGGSFNAPSIATTHPSFLVTSNIQPQDKQSSGQGSAQEATAKKMATLADFTRLSLSDDRNSYARLVHRLSSF